MHVFHLIVKAHTRQQAEHYLGSHLGRPTIQKLTMHERFSEAHVIVQTSDLTGTEKRCADWYAEDLGNRAPYPMGALTYWWSEREVEVV